MDNAVRSSRRRFQHRWKEIMNSNDSSWLKKQTIFDERFVSTLKCLALFIYVVLIITIAKRQLRYIFSCGVRLS